MMLDQSTVKEASYPQPPHPRSNQKSNVGVSSWQKTKYIMKAALKHPVPELLLG